MKIFSRKFRTGFTLIELLAVIAIIAILAAMGMVAYTKAQQNARNAKRVSDMKAIQNAFEQYAADHNGAYAACSTMGSASQGYLPQGIPIAPSGGAYTGVTCSSTTTYCYCAALETPAAPNQNIAAGNSTENDCSHWASTGDFYCVQAQQ